MSKNMLNLHKLELEDDLDFDEINELDDELDDELDELDDELDELDDELDELDDELDELDDELDELDDELGNSKVELIEPKKVTKVPNSDPIKISYTVRVAVKMLKYFSGPSAEYPVLGVIKKNEKRKIIEEFFGPKESLWGRIDSKEKAWIPLIYCERID